MAVGLKVGPVITEIGTADFFHSFFSTVCGRLEPAGWGTRFPLVMKHLYQGRLEPAQLMDGQKELQSIRRELAGFGVDQVIWDLEDRTKLPPWGDRISSHITDLSNYFVTSTGRDLLTELIANLVFAHEENLPATIVTY